MKMDEAWRSRIPDSTDELTFLDQHPSVDARGDGVEVPEQHDVVAETSTLAEGMSRHDRRSEEPSHVEHLRITFLMLEGDHVNRRAFGLREIDGAVADVLQGRAAPLSRVGLIEVVTGYDVVASGEPWWDRVAVGVVVRGALGQSWDLLVCRPAP